MPSGSSVPKPQTWRIEKASAAAFMARSAWLTPSILLAVTIARAPVRLSATVNSACRQSSGSSATTRPGAMRCQHRQHEFDGVGQLNRDNGVVRQPGFDEMRRQRRDRSIGFGEGQAFWRLAGDALLVERIEQRQRVRLSRQDPSKQSVERRRCVGLNHGITSVGPAFATRFPGDTRSRRWPQAVLSDSSARSIALPR